MRFFRKHKKATIICSIVFVLLIILVVLMFTVFLLKDVKVELKTGTEHLTQEVVSEIENEALKTGGSVLFLGKEKLISRLEKQFPYLKIVNIETQIPNKLVIHAAGREELFAVNSGEKSYFLDEEFKILRVENSIYSKQENGAVLLSFGSVFINSEDKAYAAGVDLKLDGAEAGRTLNIGNSSEEQNYFSKKLETIALSILTSFEENGLQIQDVRSRFQSFEIFFKPVEFAGLISWQPCLKIVDSANFEAQIILADSNLTTKIGVYNQAISEASKNPGLLVNKILYVFENSNNEIAYSFSNK
jgi:biopolymer transport protein ExbD